MNIIKLTIYIFILLLLGCSASSVVKPGGSNSAKSEESRTGIIRYLNQGAPFLIKRRRNEVYQRMAENCNGKYIIVNESIRYVDDARPSKGKSTDGSGSQYVYIEYKCLN